MWPFGAPCTDGLGWDHAQGRGGSRLRAPREGQAYKARGPGDLQRNPLPPTGGGRPRTRTQARGDGAAQDGARGQERPRDTVLPTWGPASSLGRPVQEEGLPAAASRLSERGVRETWLHGALTAQGRRRRLVPSLQHGDCPGPRGPGGGRGPNTGEGAEPRLRGAPDSTSVAHNVPHGPGWYRCSRSDRAGGGGRLPEVTGR